jgi:hypothetical protein
MDTAEGRGIRKRKMREIEMEENMVENVQKKMKED